MAAIVDQDEPRAWVRRIANDLVDEFVDLIISNVLLAALPFGIVRNERFVKPI